MTPGTHEDGESLEFLRYRVAKFGLFAGFFVFLFWVYRMASGDAFATPDSLAHLAAALLLLLVWPVLNVVPPSARFVRWVESIAVCGSSALLIAMGMSLQRALTRPELIVLLALTFVSCSRAVYVPSSGRRTAAISLVIGAALLAFVYASYRDIEIAPLLPIFPELAGMTPRKLAVGITINTGMWWCLYMSPEAVSKPSSVDARSDLYALGAVGYYLLVGRHVFEGASIVEVCSHHLLTPPVPPSKRLGKELPAALEALVLACLAKAQSDRPASAAEFAERLREAALEPWDSADANAWWSSHRIESSLSRPSKAAGSHTIMVDLARRTP
jgi:hypothetical protein